MKVKFDKLTKEEEKIATTMIMEVVDNFDIIKGCARNVRTLEKKLGTAESTHAIVYRAYAAEARHNCVGAVRAYLYNECESSLKKKLCKDSNFEVYHDISKLPIMTKKSTVRATLASICNAYIKLQTLAVEHNKAILSDLMKTLIRKCDNSLSIMLLEDNIDSIVYILMQFIDDVNLIIKGDISATVVNAAVDKRIGKDVVFVLMELFTTYKLFDNKLQEKLVKGLERYMLLDLVCVEL
mgnify:FL=1|nr:MAG TPA: hypothetical protein [Caudoviricetes sp.]